MERREPQNPGAFFDPEMVGCFSCLPSVWNLAFCGKLHHAVCFSLGSKQVPFAMLVLSLPRFIWELYGRYSGCVQDGTKEEPGWVNGE